MRIRHSRHRNQRAPKEVWNLSKPQLLVIITGFILALVCPSCRRSEQTGSAVRLAYIQSDLHHLPAFVALEKGLYREEGLRVEVAGIFKAGPELMSGLSAGSLDAGYVGLAPALVAAANRTARITVIAQVNKNGSIR